MTAPPGAVDEENAVFGNTWEIETHTRFVRERLAAEAATERMLAEAATGFALTKRPRSEAGRVRLRLGLALIALGARVAGARGEPAAWGGAACPPSVGPVS